MKMLELEAIRQVLGARPPAGFLLRADALRCDVTKAGKAQVGKPSN